MWYYNTGTIQYNKYILAFYQIDKKCYIALSCICNYLTYRATAAVVSNYNAMYHVLSTRQLLFLAVLCLCDSSKRKCVTFPPFSYSQASKIISDTSFLMPPDSYRPDYTNCMLNVTWCILYRHIETTATLFWYYKGLSMCVVIDFNSYRCILN